MPVTTTRRGWAGQRPGHRTSFPVRTVAARYTSPGRPRAEIAFATVSTSNGGAADLGVDLAVDDRQRRPRGRRVAVEHVARRAAVDDDLPAEVADLGDVGVADADHPGVGRRRALEDHVRVEGLVEAAGLGSRRRVDHEDQRVVVGPDRDARRAAGGATPAGRRSARRAPTPRRSGRLPGRRPGSCGNAAPKSKSATAMSVLPDDDGGAIGLQRAQRVDHGARVRAVEHEVAGDEDSSGRSALIAASVASSAGRLPWMSDRTAIRVIGAPRPAG